MSAITTVMGPEDSNAPENFLRAPRFDTKTDKFQYRRDVRMWYEYVLTSVEAGDNKAKGIAGNLGISMYSRMDHRYKRIIESAREIGKIKFTNDDGSKMSPEEQIETVNTILDMIAKDTPTDHIRRLIRMNKAIYTCRRKKGESVSEYIARFRSAANAYLSHTIPTSVSSCQDEQNFAMMIIENAELDLTTYNNIVRDLISESENDQLEPALPIEIKTMKKIRDQARKAKDTIHVINDDIAAILTQQIDITKIAELRDIIDNLVDELDDIKVPQDETRLRERLRYSLSLDKAVLSLEDVKTSVDTLDAQTKDTSGNKAPKIGTMLGNSHEYNDELSAIRSKNRFYAQRRKSNKQKSYGRKGYGGYQRNDRPTYRRDSDTRQSELLSDDDIQREPNTRSVHKRLGKRRDQDDADRPQKKVRFEEQEEIIDDENHNDGDPYFRKEVRARSSRT